MPFGTKAEIVETMARWLARPDAQSACEHEFIPLAENDIERELDLTFADDSVTGTITVAGEITLPETCLFPTNLSIGTAPPWDIAIITPLQAAIMNEKLNGDHPQYGYRFGEKLMLIPSHGTLDSEYTLEFRKIHGRLAAATSAETSDLLTQIPDALLYGGLIHAAPYFKADVRVGTFEARYGRVIEGIKKLEFRKRTGGMVLRMRPYRVA